MNSHIPNIQANVFASGIIGVFRSSLQFKKLFIGVIGIMLIVGCGQLVDIFKPVTCSSMDTTINELEAYTQSPQHLNRYFSRVHKNNNSKTGLFSTLHHFYSMKFQESIDFALHGNLKGILHNTGQCFRAIYWSFIFHPFTSCIFFFASSIIAFISAAAICRISALKLALNKDIGIREAFLFSFRKIGLVIYTPILPLIVIAVGGSFIITLSLLCNIPFAGEFLMAILTPLSIILGLIIALFSVIILLSIHLSLPAVAFESSNAYDIISRCFDYVLKKPLHIISYFIISAFYGSVCYIVVRFAVFMTLLITRFFLSLGIFTHAGSINKLDAIWPAPAFTNLISQTMPDLSWYLALPSYAIKFCLFVFVAFLISFVINFYLISCSLIYVTLRKQVDYISVDTIN